MPSAPLWHVTLRASQDWWNDNCLRLAASLAYYTALSLAPLVLLIVGVIGLVLDRQQVGSQLTAQLEGLIGSPFNMCPDLAKLLPHRREPLYLARR